MFRAITFVFEIPRLLGSTQTRSAAQGEVQEEASSLSLSLNRKVPKEGHPLGNFLQGKFSFFLQGDRQPAPLLFRLLVHQEEKHSVLNTEGDSNDSIVLGEDPQPPKPMEVATLPKILQLTLDQAQH